MSWIVVTQMFGLIYGWLVAGLSSSNDDGLFMVLTCPVFGHFGGDCVGPVKAGDYETDKVGSQVFTTLTALPPPMIGTFVVVGQMLAAHGSCSAVVR
jgi:hypothetical protein